MRAGELAGVCARAFCRIVGNSSRGYMRVCVWEGGGLCSPNTHPVSTLVMKMLVAAKSCKAVRKK